MTVAAEYQNVADWCAGFAIRDEPIPPRAAANLASVLMDLAERVKLMENIPMRLDAPEVRLGFHRLHEDHDAD
jgi:hypothetical protein